MQYDISRDKFVIEVQPGSSEKGAKLWGNKRCSEIRALHADLMRRAVSACSVAVEFLLRVYSQQEKVR